MDKIIGAIMAEFGPLSPKAITDFKAFGKIRKAKKGDILVSEGEFSHELYYLFKGGARAYYLKDGKIITDWFAFENDFISSIVSFFLGVPSQHYIEVLEDSTFMVLQRADIDALFDAHHDFERLGRLSVTKTMLQLQHLQKSVMIACLKNTRKSNYERL